jgi:hypothetical protein
MNYRVKSFGELQLDNIYYFLAPQGHIPIQAAFKKVRSSRLIYQEAMPGII